MLSRFYLGYIVGLLFRVGFSVGAPVGSDVGLKLDICTKKHKTNILTSLIITSRLITLVKQSVSKLESTMVFWWDTILKYHKYRNYEVGMRVMTLM